MNFLKGNLFLQVLIAMILGVLCGFLFPSISVHFEILATIFIRLIKLVIAPIIFITIILGINSHRHHGEIGPLAIRTLIYFEIMSVVATVLSFFIFILLQPGRKISFDNFQGNLANFSAPETSTTTGFQDFILHSIPDNFLGTLASENFIAIVILATLSAIAILKINKPDKIIHFFEESNKIFFKMIGIISKLSPYAAFGSLAALVAKSGSAALIALSAFIGTIFLVSIIFFLILAIVSYLYEFNIFKLIAHIKTEILIAWGTSSSESIFPQLMEKLNQFGCSKKVVGFVLPIGYAFNLAGTAIYVTAGALFLQQMYHIQLTFIDYSIILGTILIVSKGAAGVSGAGFITLSAVLVALPNHMIPIEGLAILLGIDRLMSDARTLINVIGNSVGTVIIAKAEKEFKPNSIEAV